MIASGTRGRELQEVATYISRELRGSGIKLLDTKDTTGQLEKHLMRYCFPIWQQMTYMLKLRPSIHGMVTDIQVNVYIENTLLRLSFQN